METEILAGGNHFLSIFQTFLHGAVSSRLAETNPSCWSVKKDFLSSGNHFFSFIFQMLLAVKAFFPSSVNLFSNKSFNLASGNHFVSISQISRPLAAVFPFRRYLKWILYYGQWERIFCLLETIFFHSYFFETIIRIWGRPTF